MEFLKVLLALFFLTLLSSSSSPSPPPTLNSTSSPSPKPTPTLNSTSPSPKPTPTLNSSSYPKPKPTPTLNSSPSPKPTPTPTPTLYSNSTFFSAPVFHIHSPMSPFYSREVYEDAKFDNGMYLMSYKIGDPPQWTAAILDTSLSMSWLQCQPCKNCYSQTGRIFDPSKSKTFKKLSCDVIACDFCNPGGTCGYEFIYDHDAGYTRGEICEDKIEFINNPHFSEFVGPLIFGCGYDNTLKGTKTPGFVGLAKEFPSFPLQFPWPHNKVSYCFDMYEWGYIKFGQVTAAPGRSTPILGVGGYRNRFYFLELQGITFGSTKLLIPNDSMIFRPEEKNGGIFLATATTYTLLHRDVFEALVDQLDSKYSKFRVHSPPAPFQVCYTLPEQFVWAEVIIFHFTGVDLPIDSKLFWFRDLDEMVCLPILIAKSSSKLGTYMLQKVEVYADLVHNRITFTPLSACTDRM